MKSHFLFILLMFIAGFCEDVKERPVNTLTAEKQLPDEEGNLYIVNQTTDTLLLYKETDTGYLLLKSIAADREEAFLVDIPNPEGNSVNLAIWKASEISDMVDPNINEVYRRWSVLLSSNNNLDERDTWVITDKTGDIHTGTVYLDYPTYIGVLNVPARYNVDVYLNSQNGARIAQLSPGTVRKNGLPFDINYLYFHYWESDPNSTSKRRDIGWYPNTADQRPLEVSLNASNDNMQLEIPVFIDGPTGRAGVFSFTNQSDKRIVLWYEIENKTYEDRIEKIVITEGNTDNLSTVEPYSKATFLLPENTYKLNIKSTSGTNLSSITDVTVEEEYPTELFFDGSHIQ